MQLKIETISERCPFETTAAEVTLVVTQESFPCNPECHLDQQQIFFSYRQVRLCRCRMSWSPGTWTLCNVLCYMSLNHVKSDSAIQHCRKQSVSNLETLPQAAQVENSPETSDQIFRMFIWRTAISRPDFWNWGTSPSNGRKRRYPRFWHWERTFRQLDRLQRSTCLSGSPSGSERDWFYRRVSGVSRRRVSHWTAHGCQRLDSLFSFSARFCLCSPETASRTSLQEEENSHATRKKTWTVSHLKNNSLLWMRKRMYRSEGQSTHHQRWAYSPDSPLWAVTTLLTCTITTDSFSDVGKYDRDTRTSPFTCWKQVHFYKDARTSACEDFSWLSVLVLVCLGLCTPLPQLQIACADLQRIHSKRFFPTERILLCCKFTKNSERGCLFSICFWNRGSTFGHNGSTATINLVCVDEVGHQKVFEAHEKPELHSRQDSLLQIFLIQRGWRFLVQFFVLSFSMPLSKSWTSMQLWVPHGHSCLERTVSLKSATDAENL